MKAEKSIVFIIPYFGKFNNYFKLFLNSCKFNQSVNWLIYTDDKEKYNYPENVKVVYTSFKEIEKNFQSKFDFKINLKRPYKLCDFRPSYGYVFQDDIKDYDFWGYCDSDVIFGDIRKFYTDEILANNDKIGFFGHCSIIKNTKDNNELFMKKIDDEEVYKKVFTTDEGFAFDEEFHNSINDIFYLNKKRCHFNEYQANIYRKSSNFKLTKYNFKNKTYSIEKKQNAFFVFDNGKVIRYFKNGDIKEFLYIHMQSRRMNVKTNNYNLFKIIPNSFDEFNNEQLKNLKKIKIKHFNLHYFKHRGKNLIIKIKKRRKAK